MQIKTDVRRANICFEIPVIFRHTITFSALSAGSEEWKVTGAEGHVPSCSRNGTADRADPWKMRCDIQFVLGRQERNDMSSNKATSRWGDA